MKQRTALVPVHYLHGVAKLIGYGSVFALYMTLYYLCRPTVHAVSESGGKVFEPYYQLFKITLKYDHSIFIACCWTMLEAEAEKCEMFAIPGFSCGSLNAFFCVCYCLFLFFPPLKGKLRTGYQVFWWVWKAKFRRG